MTHDQAPATTSTQRLDPALQARIDELLGAMTLEEKAGQLTQYFYFQLPAGSEVEPALGLDTSSQPARVEAALGRGEVGSLLFVTDPAEINRLQRLAVEGNRHGIPALFGFDVIHGFRTVFPVPIAMAASWDPATIEAGQAVAAREARAVGIHWAFAPMVDIARDPRWGRIIEGAGEDPFLGAAVAVAQVRGFQGERLGAPERIIAGPKHFAGYGYALGGRDYDEVNLSDSELWNVVFPPFAAAVEAGAGNVMTAYMDLNGIPASGNRWLFEEVLRDTFGFDGFVVSDANAVRNLTTHGFATDLADAAARAVGVGLDMEMAIDDPAYAHLPEAVRQGAVSEATLDASVRRVLEAKLRLGLFDAPYVDEDRARQVLDDPAHREVARTAAERAAVLLRNEGDLLPLDAGALRSVAVLGPLADSRRDTVGPWVFDFDLDETVTVLEGIRARAGDGVEVRSAPGIRPAQRTFPSMFDMFGGNAPQDPADFDDEAELARAVELARSSDVAVVVVGEWQNMIGEAASTSTLELPGRQLELLQAVAGTGTPVVLLVMNGRPLDLRWAAEHVPAILDIWYPGSQGGSAVANLLFGDVSPAGGCPSPGPARSAGAPGLQPHPQPRAREPAVATDEQSTPLFPSSPRYSRFDDELLGAMTLEEKAGQLTQYFYFQLPAGSEVEPALGLDTSSQPARVEAALGRGEVGSLLFVTDPAEINRLQRLAVEGNRHGIPALFGFDVIHGFRTVFPVPIAMAASWDPATIEAGQAVAAREARAVGIHWAFAPMVDIARDPRWGRIIEGAGEDPFLGAAVAVAQVRGFQGERLGAPERIIAGPKHFAGYGYALGGRDYDEVNLSDSELWNVVFPPFAAAVEAGAGNVMTAYMDLNGIPASGNRWLFEEVLRDTFGFDGFVVSDANAVRNLTTHGFATDLADAAARAVGVGLDMEMAIDDPAYAHLPEAVRQGAVSEATLDASVRRVLEAKLRLGLFDAPYVDEDRARQVLDDPAHREVARTAAERAAVLLRNEGDLLPLDAGALRSVAVLGPLADSRRDTVGPWVFDFDLDETVTVLEGIRARAGDGVEVRSAPGIRPAQRTFPSMFDMFGGNAPEDPADFDDEAELARAVELARSSDVAVVVVGEWQNMIGEAASTSTLELPGRQLELLQAVAGTGTPVVLLVMNGRPLDLRWAAEHVPAILDIWYPGSQGGSAVANLLFGDVSPAGRLPFTWPRTVGQVPLVYSHTRSHEPENQGRRYWDEQSTPLFPFGFGLGYSRFDYDELAVDRETIGADESVTVSVRVTNAGERDADEVVQLYLHQRTGTASRPVRELKGFRRVALAAGDVADPVLHARAGGAALLERRRPRLGAGRLDLRRLGRRRLPGPARHDLHRARPG